MFQLVFNAEGPVIKLAIMMKRTEPTSDGSYSLPHAPKPEYLSAWQGLSSTFRAMDRCPPLHHTHTLRPVFRPFLHLRDVCNENVINLQTNEV